MVGSCGVCGVPGDCTAPSSPCKKIGIRGDCPDLVCSYLNWGEPGNHTVPSAKGVGSVGVVPADPTRIFEITISNLHGYYNSDDQSTKLNFYVDALSSPSNSIEAAVSYDFTGKKIHRNFMENSDKK